ncbi:phage minor tail protein L [Testudinibacter sp. TR-2022]|uniref:phage minor tail protein L n=1 Tax=Testudinibacter sp. TR-2022 TaxID=2585029 RepID=UPI001119DE71|nr:phage minor tail protein L [Testudinibacter sp. TR-2022]TNH06620.1 phage minor tail protein L [Pasteurellaceae bacterium Phil11]TNH25541.1 phage minor tail protein L [Testudinibacter sp. TR-2022]TNH25679.1 phage minor tail protein L [Testudinibacter sp. TR-2022]
MSNPISAEFKLELAKLEQDTLLELFEIDLRSIVGKKGAQGDVFRFYSGLNELKKNVVFQGQEYFAYPIQATGFELSGQGPSNRPTLTISNLYGVVTGLVDEFGQGVGAKVTRRRVLLKYLDAVNFSGGNKHADPSEGRTERFIIERLSQLNNDVATFELALPAETDNARIPVLMIMSDTCIWQYRSPQCGYTGGAVADEFDQPTTDLKKDQCSKCLTGCKLRWGESAVLPYGAFPSTTQY